MCYMFYGDDLSLIVFDNYDYDGCFSACSYNLSYLLIIFLFIEYAFMSTWVFSGMMLVL